MVALNGISPRDVGIWAPRDYLICLLGFVLLATPLLHELLRDRPPEPVYPAAGRLDAGLWLKDNESATLRVTTAERGVTGIAIPVATLSSDYRIYGEARVKGERIARGVTHGDALRLTWDEPLGGNIRLSVKLRVEVPYQAPGAALFQAASEPGTAVSIDNLLRAPEGGARPVFILLYETPAPLVGVATGALALLSLLVLRRRHRKAGEMGGLICGALFVLYLSFLNWVHMEAELWVHADPDGYLYYSWALREAIRPTGDLAFVSFWQTYEHLHLPLVPGILALAQLTPVDGYLAYTLLTAVLSFGSLLIVHAIATRGLGAGAGTALVVALGLLLHYRFARSFAKPSPDMAGVILASVGLGIIVWRYHAPRSWQLPALALTYLLAALARPQGITYLVPFAGLALAADLMRDGHLKNWWRRSLPIAGVFVAALGLLGGLYAIFDWVPSFERSLEKNRSFAREGDLPWQIGSAIKALQFIPILTLLGIRRSGWHPAYLIPLGWVIYHLVLFPSVNAPVLSTRLYLPVLPAVFLLLVPWCKAHGRWRWELWPVVGVYLAVNGLLIVHLFCQAGVRKHWEQLWFR